MLVQGVGMNGVAINFSADNYDGSCTTCNGNQQLHDEEQLEVVEKAYESDMLVVAVAQEMAI